MLLYSYYCKPILFGVFVTVIICVTARPAENNAQSVEIPSRSDFVQMSDRNRNSESWSWRSFPKRTGTGASASASASGNELFTRSRRRNGSARDSDTDADADSHVRVGDSPSTESRKLSVIATSSNEMTASAITDVECKSESKPLFFKSILNKIRSAESPPQPSSLSSAYHDSVKIRRTQRFSSSSSAAAAAAAAATAPVQSQPSRLKCRGTNNALNLKNTDFDSDSDSGQHAVQYSRSRKQFEQPEPTTAMSTWRNRFQPSDSYPASAANVWHPFFQQQRAIPTASDDDDFVRKLHPSAVLPASFAYYPYSSLDNDYYQAVANAAAAAAAAAAADSRKPSYFGDKVNPNRGNNVDANASATATDYSISRPQNTSNQTRQDWQSPPLTKIILRPQASAIAGKQGIAISAPISTAYVKRGDYVEIEYLPQSKADVGEGGVAISRPELIINFVDRRK